MGKTFNITACILSLLFVMSVLSPLLSPYDPDSIDLDALKQPPSLKHPLGTDNKGRDIFTRVLSGGKLSIGISVFAVIISLCVGLFIGLLSGYTGGRTDAVMMAIVDLVLAFPSLILAIGISSLFQPGIHTVVIAISSVGWASFARIIRGHVLSLKTAEYVEAARAVGCSGIRIALVHILPQCVPPALVLSGMKLGGYILTEAALGFLGLGVQPPTATWGSMVSSGRAFLNSAPWMALTPGFFIAATALCFNLMGDSLKEKIDLKRNVL